MHPHTPLRRLSALLLVAFGCAPVAGTMEALEERSSHDDAEDVVLPSEILARWDLDGEWVDSAPIDAIEGTNRVAVQIAMGTPDLVPVMEARLYVNGAPSGEWMPLEPIWSEHDHHVLVAEFDQVGDGAQVRMHTRVAEMVQSLRWTAAMVLEGDSDRVGDDVGGSASPLSAELESAGVVSRASWGARSTRCSSSDRNKTRIAIHHTVSGSSNPERSVRSIQQYHMNGRGWCDVGYHFLIGIDGTIYEGRPLDLRGAHVGGNNTGNIGISFIGCFHNAGCSAGWGPRRPPEVMVCAAGRLAHVLAERYGISVSPSRMKGHREHSGASTSCPGEYLAARLGDLRNIATTGVCGGEPPPAVEPPPEEEGAPCDHRFGGAYGEGACSAAYQCCGGGWRSRTVGCGECACEEPTGEIGCFGASSEPEPEPEPEPEEPPTDVCVHHFGGSFVAGGCSESYQCCGGAWEDRGTCGACTCEDAGGSRGCSAMSEPEPEPEPEPGEPEAPAGASCSHSFGGAYANTACSEGWQCCDGAWRARGGCGACFCVEPTGEVGCGRASSGGGGSCGDVHAGLTQSGSQIPRSGVANGTLRRALGVSVEPYGDMVNVDGLSWVRGKISWFGGPRDTGVTASEPGTITGENLRSLNSPLDPPASTLAARPADYYYIAMRWDYSPNGRSFWRNARFVVRNPVTGASVIARAVDWGPHTDTRRVIDVSPEVLSALGMSTDDNALVAFAEPGTPLGPTATERCD